VIDLTSAAGGRRRIVRCVLSLAASTMFVQAALSQQSPGDDGNLPVLYQVKLDASQIAIDVVSFGCTDASYFSVQLDPAPADSHRLSIIRQKQDMCRMSPHIVTLTMDLPTVANLAGAKFVLVNKLATPGSLRRSQP
jgi:hypothetical protein